MITLTEKERQEALREIAEHYGRENQLEMLVEECAELIQAVQKMKRSECLVTTNNFIGEFADVWIMIHQIAYLLEVDEYQEWAQQLDAKINRQLKRMKEGD